MYAHVYVEISIDLALHWSVAKAPPQTSLFPSLQGKVSPTNVHLVWEQFLSCSVPLGSYLLLLKMGRKLIFQFA